MTGLAELLAERAIRAVVMRYCRAIDRMDEELLRGCYHPDATEDHGGYRGDLDGFVAWVWPMLDRYTMTMHVVANTLVDFAAGRPDVARAETYGVAYHRDEREPGSRRNFVSGFRYLDRFEHRPGAGWRIAARVVAVEWSRADPAEGHVPLPPSITRGARDRTDPLYHT
ncbi:nuclear transport factor 2 family protein [Phytohabitans sp. ZYX-F-186]|uniref:Nuclear transport factor 2 family protein n=1 Tax=Phytohabitans maris TaxID=3071409 RepID=A0ABU0Z9M1_9ACTN|nr:nuclear transport factor 2 family protein [Phytohabitans sp. ZYX-F-186]MDQ7903733.1 nuclear transport factor 2 family protein [Phytohabitans sp. ZYX-F-186]